MDPIMLYVIPVIVLIYTILVIMIPIWIKEIRDLNKKQLNVLLNINNKLSQMEKDSSALEEAA